MKGEVDQTITRAAWSQTLSSLSRSLIHELRSPINSLHLTVQMVQQVITDPDDPRREGAMDAIASQVPLLVQFAENLQLLLTAPGDEPSTGGRSDATGTLALLVALCEPHARSRRVALDSDLAALGNRPVESKVFKALVMWLVASIDASPETVKLAASEKSGRVTIELRSSSNVNIDARTRIACATQLLQAESSTVQVVEDGWRIELTGR